MGVWPTYRGPDPDWFPEGRPVVAVAPGAVMDFHERSNFILARQEINRGAVELISATEAAYMVGITEAELWRLVYTGGFPRPYLPDKTQFYLDEIEVYTGAEPGLFRCTSPFAKGGKHAT